MKNETILCISNRSWDAMWGESQKLMVRMARQNRVLFFEPGRSVHRPLFAEMWENLPNLFSLNYQIRQENLITIPCPSSLPIARRHLPQAVLQATTPAVNWVNSSTLIRQVRRAMHKFEVESPILWLYSPYHHSLVGKFGEKLACYHNYDEFPDFVDNARIKDTLQRYDNALCRTVDVVFTTSRPQQERRKAHNPHAYFVPNGVNFELFNQALSPETATPPDIAAIRGPIIGFAGWLGDHVDSALLLQVAQAYPNHSLVLVGPDSLPASPARDALRTQPNVHFLGMKKLEELPSYLKAFDVALIPYELVGHVLSGYPQKLHEYLAAGRSIVATAMPELRPYQEVVRIAENNEAFVQLIAEALPHYNPEIIGQRTAVAQQNTWDHRVTEYYRILAEMLQQQPIETPMHLLENLETSAAL